MIPIWVIMVLYGFMLFMGLFAVSQGATFILLLGLLTVTAYLFIVKNIENRAVIVFLAPIVLFLGSLPVMSFPGKGDMDGVGGLLILLFDGVVGLLMGFLVAATKRSAESEKEVMIISEGVTVVQKKKLLVAGFIFLVLPYLLVYFESRDSILTLLLNSFLHITSVGLFIEFIVKNIQIPGTRIWAGIAMILCILNVWGLRYMVTFLL